MTHPHYYASTSRNLDRVLQYGVYPFAYAAALIAFRDNAKATHWARLSGATASALLTTAFLGLESQTMDSIVRDAVSAEMGVKPEDFKTSDCKYSQNVIAKEGYKDMVGLQPIRYFKDALFLLPSLIEHVHKSANAGMPLPISKKIRASFDSRDSSTYNKNKHSPWEIFANGHPGWDMSIYMGTSAYWGYETFLVNKKSYYPVAQDIVGKIKPTDGYITENHLMDIYQRARNDRHLPMIEWKEEHEAIRPLFKRIVDAYNKHDGKIDVPEIVYLFGLDKINIHAPGQRAVSQEAIAQSHNEIDRIMEIGLAGIRAENQAQRMQKISGAETIDVRNPSNQDRVSSILRRELDNKKTFVDRFADASIRTTQSALAKIGMLPRRPESYISAADPTELIGTDSGVRGFR